MKELKKYLLYSQISLFLFLAICTLIIPRVAIKEGGVSNFGNHLSTFVLYIFGFLAEAFFIYLAGLKINKMNKNLKYIAHGLMALSYLIIIVLISTFPRHFSFTFSELHDYLGVILFFYQFLIALWILKNQFTFENTVFILVQSIGSIIGLLSILKYIDLLYVGQIIGAIGFGLILVLGLPDVISLHIQKDSKK